MRGIPVYHYINTGTPSGAGDYFWLGLLLGIMVGLFIGVMIMSMNYTPPPPKRGGPGVPRPPRDKPSPGGLTIYPLAPFIRLGDEMENWLRDRTEEIDLGVGSALGVGGLPLAHYRKSEEGRPREVQAAAIERLLEHIDEVCSTWDPGEIDVEELLRSATAPRSGRPGYEP